MNQYFDKTLHYLGQNKLDPYVVQIGAMDGVSFDEGRGYINMYDWKGLYVEPMPDLWTKLILYYGSKVQYNKFEQSAITDVDGPVEMLRIDPAAISTNQVHPCFEGMSAIWPPRNGLGSEGDKQTVEKYGQKITVSGITLDTLFKKHQITKFDIFLVDAEGHDWNIFKQLDLAKYRPKVIRLEICSLTDEEKNQITQKLSLARYHWEFHGQNIDAVTEEMWKEVSGIKETTKNRNLTVVTGIWDLKRHQAGEGFKRPFQHYIDNFVKLLQTDVNMAIFIEKQYEDIVWQYRKKENTRVYIKEVGDFRTKFDFFDKIQQIRTNEKWFNQAEWLKNSTQATLEMYNPMVMSKMFMLHDAVCFNPFNDEHYIWLDGGITNTVHQGYFTHDKILDKITPYLKSFLFLSFPYTGNNEIHGFERVGMNKYAEVDSVNYVCRGGLFGGHKDVIKKANATYYHLLANSLSEGYMGTEESIFTIMAHLEPNVYNRFMLQDSALISYFAEELKNDRVKLEIPQVVVKTGNATIDFSKTSTALYIISFNSPEQFEAIVESYLDHRGFITNTVNYLLDNSVDLSTTPRYQELCKKYNFVHIKKDNLGICGGRQFIAEHFEESGHDFYIFLEDDMLLKKETDGSCNNGFVGYVPDLYHKVHKVLVSNNYDFVKFSFTEFYGSNTTQWAWYNVPQALREEIWPEKPTLPKAGLDPNAPKTKFNNIQSIDGLSYADGEIYYCNWPQLVSKAGNKKMFLDTKWAHPFEQTWMSHMYQLSRKGELKSAVLLASPINHHRFKHYSGSLRREN